MEQLMRWLVPCSALIFCLASCRQVESPGGPLTSLEGGLVQQATFQDSPITVSPARLAQLRGQASASKASPGAPASLDPASPTPGPGETAGPGREKPPKLDEPETATPAAHPPPASPAAAPPPTELAPLPPSDGINGPEAQAISHGNTAPAPRDETLGEGSDDLKATASLTEPLGTSAPAPAQASEFLPPAPRSDQDALAALDRVARAEAPAAPDLVRLAEPSPPCDPDAEILSVPTSLMRMTAWWIQDGTIQAELSLPSGKSVVVGQGDRVGPEGGKVVRVDRSQVVVGEVGFDLNGAATIQAKTIKLVTP